MSNSIYTRTISAYAKKILYALWAYYALSCELYDVGITYITFWRSVELCSAERFFAFHVFSKKEVLVRTR